LKVWTTLSTLEAFSPPTAVAAQTLVNVITPTHLEEPTPFTHHNQKNAHLPCPGAVLIIIRSRNLVSSLHRFQSPRGLSYEVSKATAANQMAPIHPEWRHHRDNWPSIHLWHHRHRRNAVFGHVARLPDDGPAHNFHINISFGRPPSSQWLRRAQAVPVADGSINSGQITTFHLQTSGGVLSTVVTERRRYGPCTPAKR